MEEVAIALKAHRRNRPNYRHSRKNIKTFADAGYWIGTSDVGVNLVPKNEN